METGCLPSSQDMGHPEYGDLIKKYLDTGVCDPVNRARIARLIEWLTVGGGIPGCMHGGGSPDGARRFVLALSPLEEFVQYAKSLAGIDEDISEPKA